MPLRIPPKALLLNSSCGNTYGSNCVFGCQSGYVQDDGNANSTCLETGQWSGIPIYCISMDVHALNLPTYKRGGGGEGGGCHRSYKFFFSFRG